MLFRSGRLGRLLPLFFVLVAATLALGWLTLRGREPRPLPRSVAVPAAAFFAFAFLSLLWADDLRSGTNLLLFFTVPFAALLAVVARADFPDWIPRALGIVAIALASLFAAVGLWQAATHELLHRSRGPGPCQRADGAVLRLLLAKRRSRPPGDRKSVV